MHRGEGVCGYDSQRLTRINLFHCLHAVRSRLVQSHADAVEGNINTENYPFKCFCLAWPSQPLNHAYPLPGPLPTKPQVPFEFV